MASVAQPNAHHHHHDGKFSCQLAITEFAGDQEAPHVGNRHNFDFTLDMSDVGVPQSHKEAMVLESEALKQVALRCASRCVSRAGSRVASRAASRVVSRAVSRMPSLDNLNDDSLYEGSGCITDDAFEQIMNVTTHHEALMAYYFLDDNNEVRVTEIFDMTDDDPTADPCGLEVDADHRITIPSTNMSHWTMSHNDSLNSEDYEESGNSTLLSDTESENCHRCVNEPEAEQDLSSLQHGYSLHS